MKTYSSIIENIIKTKNNIFLPKTENDNVDIKFKILFGIFLLREYSVVNKFSYFYEMLDSFWIKGEKSDVKVFIDYFCKIQKTYNILNRFAYNYKCKKTKVVVNIDMGLNELKENDRNVICIFQNNVKYLFHINDLLNIIKIALTNTCVFFSEPLNIKNPYNNMPFNKSTLYNIYFFIKYKTCHYDELFFRFFKSNFNLTNFKKENEYILREYSIHHHVYKSSPNLLLEEINIMIDYFNNYCYFKQLKHKITINTEFPKDKLIRIFQPYLLLYMISHYGYTNTQKNNASRLFNHKMKMFCKYNPLFGRKKIKFILEYTTDFKRKIKGKIVEFDDNHITFNNIEKENEDFLIDHLKINDDDLTDNLEVYMNVSVYRNNTNNEDNINHTTHYNSDEEDEEEKEDEEEDEAKEAEEYYDEEEEKEEDYDY
jgi:hypothetical protein